MIKKKIKIAFTFFCCFIFFNLFSMKGRWFKKKKEEKDYIDAPFFKDEPAVKALNDLYKEKCEKRDEFMVKYKKEWGWYDLGKKEKEETFLVVNPSTLFKKKLEEREKGK